MAFKEYRNPCKNSITHEFDIERFAYDVFAYMLRICGFPEEKIPISCLKENIYIEDDFVMNVGLSALPIALYMRDEWRLTFEEIFGESGNIDILEIQNCLESFIAYSDELEEEDTLSKIQFSLALYNEYTLFLNSTGIETFDSLPKLWSRLCKELVAQSEDFDPTLESSLTMCPDVSELWISNFIRNFAVPYGSSNDVSDRFSLHTLECHAENDTFPEDTSAEGVIDVAPEESVVRPSDISDEVTVTIFLEGSTSELNYIPCRWYSPVSSGQLQIPEENALVETRAHGRHTNGLTYVLQQCLKGRKRRRSQKLEVEDAFEKINLEKENISPENRDAKRRRKISGKDTPV
ncbi:hypothetical protein AVEN_40474-1 [Araneus ventricosus]|uniref:Uncharacterized protein n=1 Tax=Araneus ventricosus TaxID=182803 RepID=A0A4Y2PU26_ARAVE|nr:hypothetical protein AVEN_40474-1 [Araneus ventricosus]